MTNNINRDLGKIHYCTGCQICSAVCPNNAIYIQIDEEGFYRPNINMELCSQCGMCIINCYKFDNNVAMTTDIRNIDVYAAYSKDPEILRTSSSGGISTHLINECLKQGYKVAGVGYSYSKDIAILEVATKVEETYTFRGSKYMQAYTEEAFKEIVRGNKIQKYAVFGTPCQIYALNRWSINNGCRRNLLFIDLFCHGYPSLYLWQQYLEYVKEKTQVRIFEKIEFRSKVRGWHEFCHSFYKDDNHFTSSNTINDPFFTIFFDNQILSPSCYSCNLRSTLEYSDIRLGDFWGADYDLNTKGVSTVVTSTKKGKELFNNILPFINYKKVSLDNVVKFQSYGKTYNYNSSTRERIFELLRSKEGMETIYKIYLEAFPLKKKLKYLAKKVISTLPNSMRNKIKTFYHGLINHT